MPENETQELEQENNQYIDALNELKANTVDKSKYEALQAENKKLLNSLVNGQTVDVPREEKIDVNELRSKVLTQDNNMNNLTYIENVMKLRKAVMDEGQKDPFLPSGHDVIPSKEEIEAANRVASVFQECIDYADGDSTIFTNELMRRTVDSMPRR